MVEFLEPSKPDKEEYDKEKERPDDLNEKSTPVPFPQGQVLPEKQLKLKEESHLVAILVPTLPNPKNVLGSSLFNFFPQESQRPNCIGYLPLSALSKLLPIVGHHQTI